MTDRYFKELLVDVSGRTQSDGNPIVVMQDPVMFAIVFNWELISGNDQNYITNQLSQHGYIFDHDQ